MSVFHAFVLLLIMNFVTTLSMKVAVDQFVKSLVVILKSRVRLLKIKEIKLLNFVR